jgi:DNA transposition AAA+ family ATPase
LGAFLDLIMTTRSQTGYTMMGVVTGNAGVGKTIALQYYIETLTPREAIGLPACITIKVAPKATAKAVATQLLTALQGQHGRHNIYDLESSAVEAIRRHDLDLILVDEGDWLTVESFEMLRHLFDRSGCPIVVVGLPSIWQVITRHEKFTSRVGMHLDFLPLTQEELLATVLPQICLPCWMYDGQSDDDLELGLLLWQHIGSSFRKLRVILQCASQLAQTMGSERITAETLHTVFQLTAIPRWLAATG